MNELRIVRGRDVGLSIDGVPLFGVTEISVTEKCVNHEVKEFLSAVPAARVPQGTVYEIKLKVMTMFGSQIPSDRVFMLCICEGGVEYHYSGCSLTEDVSYVQGNKIASQKYVIEALSFTKRVIENE